MKTKKLAITILSDKNSWLNDELSLLAKSLKALGHRARRVHTVNRIAEGDLAFFLGCGQLVNSKILARNTHNLVVHESALPKGKGWSPMTWQVLEGKKRITISLFEAVPTIDAGCIYLQDTIRLRGDELVDEWRQLQARSTTKLCLKFVSRYPRIIASGKAQRGKSTFYPKRGPKDSRLDFHKSLGEQWNLLQTVDNDRYPAYFEFKNRTYILKITKKKDQR